MAHDLSALSQAWQRFGCSVCGQTSRPDADPGWRVELHHLTKRSQGGTDDAENLIGLCGELLANKCHWRVEDHRLTIEDSQHGLAWIDTRTGETGLCRRLDLAMAAETGLDRDLLAPTALAKERVIGIVPERVAALSDEQGWNVASVTRGGTVGAETRFNLARELHLKVQRGWLALALLIWQGLEMHDERTLGFETEGQWADAIGIDKATMSKLKLIGKQFQGSWQKLSRTDQATLTIDGLYIAARMRKLGQWDEDQALAEAVAHPVQKLWGIYKTTREQIDGQFAGAERHQCPDCGCWHWKSERRICTGRFD